MKRKHGLHRSQNTVEAPKKKASTIPHLGRVVTRFIISVFLIAAGFDSPLLLIRRALDVLMNVAIEEPSHGVRACCCFRR